MARTTATTNRTAAKARKAPAKGLAAQDFDIPPPPLSPDEGASAIPAPAPAPRPPPHPPFFSRGLLLTGVVFATVLGAGAGLWARPALEERKLPGLLKPKPAGRLKIELGEAPPPPVGPPMEVMRADVPVYMSPAPLNSETLNPGPLNAETSPPQAGAAPAEARPVLRPPAPSTAAALKTSAPAAKPAKIEKKAYSAPKAAAKPKLEKVAAPAAKKPAVKTAALKKADLRKPDARAVKGKGKTVEDAKLLKTRGKAEKAEKLIRTKAKQAPKPGKLIKVAEAAKPPPKAPAKPKADPKPALDFGKLLASLKTKAETGKVEKVALAAAPTPPPAKAKAPEPAPPPARAEPPPPPPIQHAVVRDRCDLADAGEALVCRNPALQMEDRRLARAYRAAEEAGVAPWRLQQQQRRWLAARAAAARENPWAVRDVYAARIAELEDLSRDRGWQ